MDLFSWVRRLAAPSFCLASILMAVSGGPVRAAGADVPRVMATIGPLHGLVSAVMAGVGEPGLLIKGGASPHTFSLRPSDARALAGADVVFMVGAGLETGLDRAIASLAPRAGIVFLADADGVRRRRVSDAHGDGGHDRDHEGGIDPHVWLDPLNGAAMARAAARVLGERDSPRAKIYAANAEALAARLHALDRELDAVLAPVRAVPYVVFHDGYGYFEDRYRLAGAGFVAALPDRRPGAAHLGALLAEMKAKGVRCVFTEPQFPPRQAEILVKDAGATLGVLDPLGAAVPPGPGAYEAVLRRLAASFLDCLRK